MGPKLMTIGTVTTQGSIERRKELLKSQEGGIWRLSNGIFSEIDRLLGHLYTHALGIRL